MKNPQTMRRAAAFAAATLIAGTAAADEAAIRKALAERLPNMPKIDEVSKSPIPGLYEVRMGTEIVYADENGQYVIQGALIDTKTRTDLTQARIDKLTAFDFGALPLKDAVLVKQGSGARKLVIFADPNCGYCKRIERDLLTLKDVSIYTYLYPILGPDSSTKSRDIWCAKDNAKAWRAWMLDNVAPPKAAADCDVAALDRNVKLGQKHRVTGTPAVVFEDGSRAPGAVPAAQIESRIQAAAKKG
ncbi:DsbC family protein [Aquincola sp. S2]|uniref:Thiol:disulfide interchange protein n=1 Tax=Pseudaquabacterium terrae TaxID=2732868 RepID=A0ABX2EDT6_9BURK|nr:DsbC family protein [Aquabacterium terrae]NRF66781.1 DsbC family protein [Aquabacterium terrae]